MAKIKSKGGTQAQSAAPNPDNQIAQSYSANPESVLPAVETQAPAQPVAGAEQTTNEVFSQPPVKKKSNMKKMCCVCSCLFFTILLVVIGGVGVYVYKTDADIPFFSDLVDKVGEVVGSPKAKAAEVQEKTADTVIQTIFPLLTQDEGVASSFANSSITQEDFEDFVKDYEQIDSVRFDLTVDIDGSFSSTSGSSSMLNGLESVDLNMRGAIDGKQKGNEKVDSTFDVGVEMEGVSFEIKAAVKLIGADGYIKIDLFPLEDLGDALGKWIALDDEEFAASMKPFSSVSGDGEEIAKDDMQKVYDFLTDEVLVQSVELLPEETIEGNKSQCMKSTFNQDELVEVMKRYSEIFEEDFDENEARESLEGFESLYYEVCVGVDTDDIHRLSIVMRGEESGEVYEMIVDLKLWDYGEDMGITAPTDYITMEEFYNSLYGGSGYGEYFEGYDSVPYDF